ncbi:MAG: hypothetical protein GY757_52050 [bacterium]|nr:hypothetical protein [bacterium]
MFIRGLLSFFSLSALTSAVVAEFLLSRTTPVRHCSNKRKLVGGRWLVVGKRELVGSWQWAVGKKKKNE